MKYILKFIIILFVFIQNSYAQELLADSLTVKDTLIVGYKISPPFTMQDKSGKCIGVSTALWNNISEELGLVYKFKQYSFEDLLNAIHNGEVDICISPLTVTSERLKIFDFTQPFYTSNLAIACQKQDKNQVEVFITNFFSVNFLNAILLLFLVILIFGFLIWLTERKYGNNQFSKNIKGLGHGIWWSAVTMTTVGYGDKIPKSTMGRLLAIIWMFTSIIIISSLTGSIAASLTAQTNNSDIQVIDDLKNVKTGTIRGSNSADLLLNKNISFIPLDTIENGLKYIVEDKLGAFLYDEPIIRFLVQDNNFSSKIEIIPQNSNSQYYSFALPHHHPFFDIINITLIKELEDVKWKAILNDYYLSQ